MLAIAIPVIAVLLLAVSTIDFGIAMSKPQDKIQYLTTELLRKLLYLGLLIIVFAAGAVRSAKTAELDDRPAPLLLLGLIAARGNAAAPR